MSASFSELHPELAGRVFVASDPPGSQLGSGGGTVHLLLEAFRNSTTSDSFIDWLATSPKMLIHGSGESRRLQAYAAEGKPMMPLPYLPSFPAQSPQQTLLDIQTGSYSRIARLAPDDYRVMVTCGDVYLSFAETIPRFPVADVLFVGMTASADEAQHHGVMICDSGNTNRLKRFVQKPSVAQLAALGTHEAYLLDTGVWLFSEKAVKVLMAKCGIDISAVRPGFTTNPDSYDMFSAFGPSLGETPIAIDADISSLSCAVLALPESKFYHFGSSRSIMASTAALLAPAEDKRSFANASLEALGAPIQIGPTVECKLSPDNRHIWVDSSCVSSGWSLKWNHIITGIPRNNWSLSLPSGTCLSMIPLENGLLLKFYGFDDSMRGRITDTNTTLLGVPLADWLAARNISLNDAGLSDTDDIYDLPIFPLLDDWENMGEFVQWLVARDPEKRPDFSEQYIASRRKSARHVLINADLMRLQSSRLTHFSEELAKIGANTDEWSSFCRRHDLAVLSRRVKANQIKLPDRNLEWQPGANPQLALGAIHDCMLRDECGTTGMSKEAFALLRELIVHEMEIAPIAPNRNVLDDQLVWGRAPLRLDIAGGWSDTPPYCLEYGGRVVNLAVDLNGQPPIQVFGRINDRKDILLRSIDLGVSETIPSYDDLLKPGALGSEFGIAKAALALIGFDPRFHPNHKYRTLQNQLDAELGGGLELSMVCAVPKGSGLGTSSMLAATIIGTLNELCGLGMDNRAISQRTLALEQLLTSGGGWQDQIGGITPGLKFLQTPPNISQETAINWLPGTFFESDYANKSVLLYYTGITRVAHDILGEIVRNMFLNSAAHISVVRDISSNAVYAAEACQRNDWNQLCDAVRRSWHLNQLLDSGTNPPAVQGIVDKVSDHLEACKLLGAGGGGYMLMLAKDETAGKRIKDTLNAAPANAGARFVDLTISGTGLQVTKS